MGTLQSPWPDHYRAIYIQKNVENAYLETRLAKYPAVQTAYDV